jgi:SHS2 domain-containing protein
MDAKMRSGFEEVQHTADWALKVWADDFTGLAVQAARGMNSLMGIQLASEPRITREIEIEAHDRESLLVSFLSELLFQVEMDGLAFDRYDLNLSEMCLLGHLEGAKIVGMDKQIKAVTFHYLEIRSTETGLETIIVFDV